MVQGKLRFTYKDMPIKHLSVEVVGSLDHPVAHAGSSQQQKVPIRMKRSSKNVNIM